MVTKQRTRLFLSCIACVAMIAVCATVFASEPLKPIMKKPMHVKPGASQAVEIAPTGKDLMRKTSAADLISPNQFISIHAAGMTETSSSFAGDCLCCFKQGYMGMKKAMCYVRNVGNGPSVPCQAKLTWVDRNNAPQEAVMDIPTLSPFSSGLAGSEEFLLFEFPEEQYFKIDQPVTLHIDFTNQVAESKEDNNSVSFVWSNFYQQHSHEFDSCPQ